METSIRLSDIAPQQRAEILQLFGAPPEGLSDAVLVLKSASLGPGDPSSSQAGGIPEWCNVMEGMSDDEIAEFDAIIARGITLGPDQ